MKHLLLLSLVFTSCLSVHMNRIVPQVSAPELSADQRETDLRALFKNLREMDPLVHGYAQSLGLPDIISEEDTWASDARSCKDNKEFAVLVGKVVTWASQTGHSFVTTPGGVNSHQNLDAHLGLTAREYSRMVYWSDLVGKGYRLAHSQFSVELKGDNWVFSQAFDSVLWSGDKPGTEKVFIPQGTRISKIEGFRIQDWINKSSLESHLLWDPSAKLLRPRPDMDPFLLDPGKGIRGWKTTVLLGDGPQEVSVLIPKVQGIKGGALMYPKDTQNITSRILDEKTAYIKIFSFGGGDTLNRSIQEIHDFLKDPQTPTDHLIIDVRNNGGGDPRFWQEGLIRPLLAKNMEYKVQYLVTDRIESYGRIFNQLVIENPDFKGIQGPLKSNEKIGRNGALNLWEGTFEMTPLPLGLKPRRVSLLVNEVSYSATEIFAQVCKVSGFAQVYGQRTGGGGTSVAMAPPLPFSLPESGITIQIETSLTYNGDGTINQIDRTLPHVVLQTVPLIPDLSVPALLMDPWIKAVMEDASPL